MRSRKTGNEKKAHHYVPVNYLNGFTNSDNKLRVYLKDSPSKLIWQKPENTGFRNYYYSQPTPDGKWDNNTLENHFSEYEDKWPAFVARLRANEDVNDQLEYFFQYLMLQMSRAPATREMIELCLAEDVIQAAKLMDRKGMLPSKSNGCEGSLDRATATIDPHMSIRAIPKISEGFAKLLDLLGFAIVKNDTGTSFITSDNPVIWFDPSVSDENMRPHTCSPDGPILFFFPVASDIAILGSDEAKPFFQQHGLYEGRKANVRVVKQMNRLIARFAYQAFYSDSDDHHHLVEEYSKVSPTVKFENIPTDNGIIRIYQRVFGERRKPHKWKN